MENPVMSFTLHNHVAIVTGSSTGLGKSIAFTLARQGAKVAFNYFNNQARAERTFAEFQKEKLTGILVRCDVTTQEGVDSLYRETEAKLGKPDILVPNATCEQPFSPIEEYDWDFYQTMVDFFIKSPFLLTQRGIAHMKKQKWGRIINIASEVYHRAVGNFSAYVAAKGGQIGWSRSMATELAPFGVTVNVVAPGWIPVERHEKVPQAERDAYHKLIPAKRWGVPQDVADAVLYLASEEASFITGQTICVNGGMTPW
jgi:3-oxoacyl-[acyl-carrier protein] reductase